MHAEQRVGAPALDLSLLFDSPTHTCVVKYDSYASKKKEKIYACRRRTRALDLSFQVLDARSADHHLDAQLQHLTHDGLVCLGENGVALAVGGEDACWHHERADRLCKPALSTMQAATCQARARCDDARIDGADQRM